MDTKGKKRCRRNQSAAKKNKPSPVMKVDEETIPNGTINDNAVNSPDCFISEIESGIYSSNSSLEDDALLTDIVFTKILNQKKMELMDNDEITERLKQKKKN